MRILHDFTTPADAVVLDQINYDHSLGGSPYLYVDNHMVLQAVSGPGSVEVPLLYTFSSYLPSDRVLTAVARAVQWVRYNAHAICPTARFVRIYGSGISHDFIRKWLLDEGNFVAVPQPSGEFIYQYELLPNPPTETCPYCGRTLDGKELQPGFCDSDDCPRHDFAAGGSYA